MRPMAGSNQARCQGRSPKIERTCTAALPDQSALTGDATGISRPPCATVAVTPAEVPSATVGGAVSSSPSTRAIVCADTHRTVLLSGSWRAEAASPGLTGSTPNIVQPQNPPSAGAAEGVLPELPLMKYGTPPTCA